MNIYEKSKGRMIRVLSDKKCFLRCDYCLNDFNDDFFEMSDGIDYIINNINITDNDRISIGGGGEPFYSSNFENIKKLVKYVRSKSSSCLIMLTTNGVIMNDDIISFILTNKIRVNISCDIRGFEQRKFISGKPTLDIVINNIKHLVNKYGIRPMINLVVNTKNIDYLEDMLNELYFIGITKVTLGVEVEYDNTYSRHILLGIKKDNEFYKRVNDIANKVKLNKNIRFIHRLFNGFRVKINEQVCIAWSDMLNYHKKDNTMIYTSLKCREDDGIIYGKHTDYSDFDNYSFFINGIKADVMAYDLFIKDNIVRIRIPEVFIPSSYINFLGKFKDDTIISFNGRFKKLIYDRYYNVYYIYIDKLENVVV